MPPRVLLHVLANLQAEHELGNSRMAEFLAAMPQVKKRRVNGSRVVSEYFHQGIENDRLFRPSYAHTGSTRDGFRSCDASEIVAREDRDTTDPEIHYGTIASGNTLVKDVTLRDKIADDIGEECMCFEIEAAGLMNHFPCLVIRGMCDYADSHKNDQWQRYAAATAAAYGKELLGYVPCSELQQAERAIDVLKSG